MSFTEATQKFLDAADWLGPLDQPTVAIALALATELDLSVNAAMAGQYRAAMKDLMKSRPSQAPKDPVQAIIDDAHGETGL